jgi:hypothetical protein
LSLICGYIFTRSSNDNKEFGVNLSEIELGEPVKIEKGLLDNVFVIDADIKTSQLRVEGALTMVGKVTKSEPGYVEGVVRYGTNPVKLRVTLNRDKTTTQMTIQAKNQSLYSSPNKSAINRLIEAMLNLGVAGYESDRSGVTKSAYLVWIVVFLFLFFLIFTPILLFVIIPLLESILLT